MTGRMVVVCALLMAAGTAQGEFVLAREGGFVASVVVDPQVDADAKADVLRVLEAMAGAAPSVAEAPGDGPALVIGTKGFASFGGRHADLAEDGSFQIELEGNRLHVIGGSAQGAAFGAYALLNDLGCRWFIPGAIGEAIPKTKDLVWRGKPRRESPDFPFRQIWWAYGGPPETQTDFAAWLRRNKVAAPGIMHGHNLTNTVPPDSYLKEHPEYYALVGGVRRPTQLCTSNPEVVRLSIERINEYFDQNPQMLSYSLCPDDNTEFCECDNCRALDAGGWSEEFRQPVVTDRLMAYLNAVAQGIQERHPGKMVTTYAYLNYSTPPVREKVDPHVSVVFTTSVYCSAHGIGDEGCASRQEMKADLEGWIQAGPQVYVYEYDPVPYNAELPWPYFGAHARSLPVYKAIGLKGFSFEAHNSWATLSPNFYVSARLMWDCEQDAQALLEDYYTRFFRDGAGPMKAYYEAMERALREYPKEFDWGAEDYPRVFTAETMDFCRECVLEARHKARHEPARSRVEMAAMGFDYLDSYLACYRAATGGKPYDKYRGAYDRCLQIVDLMYGISKDYVLAAVAKDYLKRNLGPLEIRHYGERLGLLGEWKIVGPFENAALDGHAQAYPPEEALDVEGKYAGKDGQEIAWKEHRQRGGVVNLDALFGTQDPAVAYAACWVTSPQEQTAEIRVGSNDSVKVWLNGQLVWENKASRGVVLDQDVVPVTLPRGVSSLLVKVTNEGRAWGFCLRVTDEKGEALEGVTYRLGPPVQ